MINKVNKILITGGAGYIGSHVAEKLIKTKCKIVIVDNLQRGSRKLINKKTHFIKADIRNTKVYDIYKNLAKIGFDIRVHDPIANISDVKSLLKIDLVSWEKLHEDAHILLLAVKHDYYNKLDFTKYKSIIQYDGKIFDIKSILSKNKVKKLGLEYFNL